jgi:hypothetical protein
MFEERGISGTRLSRDHFSIKLKANIVNNFTNYREVKIILIFCHFLYKILILLRKVIYYLRFTIIYSYYAMM